MKDISDFSSKTEQTQINQPDYEIRMLRHLLKEQIRLNDEVEEKNLALINKNSVLTNQCEELSAKLGIKSKELGISRDDSEIDAGFSLELDMLKAKVSSSILKSIVSPLENELNFVKKRLNEAQALLEIAPKKCIKTLPEIGDDERGSSDESAEVVSSLGNSFSANTSNILIDTSTKLISPANPLTGTPPSFQSTFPSNLQHSPNATTEFDIIRRLEDAENFIIALIRKNNQINDEKDKLQEHINELNNKLERERAAHVDLKSTWQKANEEFIIQSVNLQDEIQRLRETYSGPSTETAEIGELSPVKPNIKEIASKDAILMNAELSRLRQQLINEQQKINDLDTAMKMFMSEVREQIFKCESECSSLDSILFGIQNEIVRQQTGDS